MCLRGASEVQQKVLAQVPDEKLRVYVVWLPMWPQSRIGLGQRAAHKETGRLSDSRVSHFWDGGRELGKAIAPNLKLAQGRTAWDVYLLFGPEARWDSTPPVQDFWMHQLSDCPEELELDGKRLADETRKLLARTQASPSSGRRRRHSYGPGVAVGVLDNHFPPAVRLVGGGR
jgi:hypothetical protein